MVNSNIEDIKKIVSRMTTPDSRPCHETVNRVGDIFEEYFEDGLWTINLKTNEKYNTYNLHKSLGYDEGEIDPNIVLTLIHVDDLRKMYVEINKHFKSKGEYKYRIILRIKHKKGHELKFLSRGKVIEWEDDKPLKMVGQFIEITGL